MEDWLGLIAVGIWGILIAGYVYAFFAIRKMLLQQKCWDKKMGENKDEQR